MAKIFTQKRIPKKINVFGIIYTIKMVDRIEPDADGREKIGECCFEEEIIYIVKDALKYDQWVTFFHECFHAVIVETSTEPLIENKHEEVIVDILSKFVVKLLNGESIERDLPKR